MKTSRISLALLSVLFVGCGTRPQYAGPHSTQVAASGATQSATRDIITKADVQEAMSATPAVEPVTATATASAQDSVPDNTPVDTMVASAVEESSAENNVNIDKTQTMTMVNDLIAATKAGDEEQIQASANNLTNLIAQAQAAKGGAAAAGAAAKAAGLVKKLITAAAKLPLKLIKAAIKAVVAAAG